MTTMEDTKHLKDLAAEKEKEWKNLQELRIKSLEAAVQGKERDLAEEKARFQKLKEDFKYNLKLLAERDAELEKYDSQFSELCSRLAEQDAEMSQLKIKIDDQQMALAREAKSREELQLHYQHRIREKQAEIDQYRSAKDHEVQQERQEIESFKRNIERQLKEAEDELDIQRRELTAEFDEALRKREHEFRKKADEMSTVVLAHELKVKLLQKELEVVKTGQQRASAEAEESSQQQRELEKQIKQQDWALQDMAAMKDARIRELESKLQHAEEASRRQQEDFQRKHEKLDRLCREKEEILNKTKQASEDRSRELQNKIRDLEKQLEDVAVEMRQLEWSRDDVVRDKDSAVQRLEEELADLKQKWDARMSETSHEEVRRDLELQSAKQAEEKLKAELMQRKADITRYKQELANFHERQSAIERAKVQLDLDWQKRYEDLERQQYEKSEDFVKKLTTARDEALAGLKEKERELQQREDLVTMLTQDRDRALATLKLHGLMAEQDVDVSILDKIPQSAADRLQTLQQQNDNLRAVIHQMRQQMETLGDHVTSTGKPNEVTEEYVRNIEQELHEWKSKYRKLEAEKQGLPTEEVVSIGAGDNAMLNNHVQALNKTMGALRTEKVELAAQVRKQQARIHHLTSQLEQSQEQPKKQQVEITQLRYELGAQQRRFQAEHASLHHRLADLELQLTEARQEADEYHKCTIEKNIEVTNLTSQLSALKVDLAQNAQTVNFGAQELIIQQLQDEVERLHKERKGMGFQVDDLNITQPLGSGTSATTAAVGQLQTKLRLAAKHIRQLAKEKQQLIEVNNRLRGQINQIGIKPGVHRQEQVSPAGTAPQAREQQPASRLSVRVQNKLNQLEQSQYELTKREIAGHKPAAIPTQSIEVASETPTDVDEEELPPPILKKGPRSGFPEPQAQRSTPSGPTHHVSSPRRDGGLVFSMSSAGGESLQELWRMLDNEGVSPRPFTPMDQTGNLAVPEKLQKGGGDILRPQSADSFTVKGNRPQYEEKVRPQPRAMSAQVQGKVQNQKPKKKKVRNYNAKDDLNVR